jgi:hypothetical protein
VDYQPYIRRVQGRNIDTKTNELNAQVVLLSKPEAFPVWRYRRDGQLIA